jgi:hypothetical protein
MAVRAPPDGYTLLQASLLNAVNATVVEGTSSLSDWGLISVCQQFCCGMSG